MLSLVPHSHRLRLALIFAFGALLYAGTLDNDFVLDDQAAIRDNPVVHRGDPAEIFTTDYWAGFHRDRSGLYRPLPVLSFSLNYRLSGPDPTLYHLVDLLLHAAAALLLYQFCRRCTRREDLAWWSSLLFAAHPVQSEAVAGLVGRADIMAALFGLMALSQHLRARRSENWRASAGVGLALAAALLSKESAIVLPALFLLTDLFQYRAFSEKRYRKGYLLYAGVVLVYLVWRRRVLGGLGVPEIDHLDNPLVALSLPLRLVNAAGILFRYLGLLLLPVHLSADYSFDALPLTRQLWSADLLFVVLGLAGLAGLLLVAWHRAPWVAFGLAWICISLGPVANVLLPIGTIMAERLLYLPAAGFAIAVAALLPEGRFPRPALAAFSSLLLILYAGATLIRTRDWQDDYSLFARTVQVRPGSARAWRVLGRAALARGEDRLGLSALGRALEILPDYYEVYDDLGYFYFNRKDYEKALEHFSTALQLRGDYPIAWFNLGLTLYHLDRRDEARTALERAIALNPRYVRAYYNLGIILLEEGELERAEELFEKTLSLDPDHAEARFNLEAIRNALK